LRQRAPRLFDEEVAFLVRSLDHVGVSIGGFDATDHRTVFGVEQFGGAWAFYRSSVHRSADRS
jgi:hypothetical protein